jgi:wyosine [tRNA(Phe)-imidazoG37] synthetase (radical SAM superfamily)
LGQSLGIDPIPFKTCNWNCVYCQLGRTSPPTNERREYIPAEDIVAEVQAALSRHPPGEIAFITFVGSGEPTLHARLGWMIRRVKSYTDLPVAVITNGSLLYVPAVREELSVADAVLPSLDAGSDEVFRKINRPHAALSFAQHVGGLIDFRNQYSGKLWVEVMLVDGLNDSEHALRDLKTVLSRIRPDEVHINLPIRPPCEPWVKPAGDEGLMRAIAILGDVARVIQPLEGDFDLTGFDDVVDAILAVIKRHPMREQELTAALERWSPGEVDAALGRLRDSGRAQLVTRFGQRFWSCADARYVEDALSRCHGGSKSDGRRGNNDD